MSIYHKGAILFSRYKLKLFSKGLYYSFPINRDECLAISKSGDNHEIEIIESTAPRVYKPRNFIQQDEGWVAKIKVDTYKIDLFFYNIITNEDAVCVYIHGECKVNSPHKLTEWAWENNKTSLYLHDLNTILEEDCRNRFNYFLYPYTTPAVKIGFRNQDEIKIKIRETIIGFLAQLGITLNADIQQIQFHNNSVNNEAGRRYPVRPPLYPVPYIVGNIANLPKSEKERKRIKKLIEEHDAEFRRSLESTCSLFILDPLRSIFRNLCSNQEYDRSAIALIASQSELLIGEAQKLLDDFRSKKIGALPPLFWDQTHMAGIEFDSIQQVDRVIEENAKIIKEYIQKMEQESNSPQRNDSLASKLSCASALINEFVHCIERRSKI